MNILQILNALDTARSKAQAVITEELRKVRGDTNHRVAETTMELKAYAKQHLRALVAKLTTEDEE